MGGGDTGTRSFFYFTENVFLFFFFSPSKKRDRRIKIKQTILIASESRLAFRVGGGTPFSRGTRVAWAVVLRFTLEKRSRAWRKNDTSKDALKSVVRLERLHKIYSNPVSRVCAYRRKTRRVRSEETENGVEKKQTNKQTNTTRVRGRKYRNIESRNRQVT